MKLGNSMRYIFTGFSPNTRAKDAWLAASLLFKRGDVQAVNKLEGWFKEYYQVNYAVAVDSGRSALQLALTAAGVEQGDEVILQAFTCVVVANAITNLGATPVYVDCGPDYVLNPELLEKAVTSRTKAVIAQHTFGMPTNMTKVMGIARQHNLKVIEDCAHSLGGYHEGKLLGTFGDLAMFSFGSDKVISGVRGGMIITNEQVLGDRIQALQAKLPNFHKIKELQHLLHPIYFYVGKKMYHWGVGKVKLYLAKKLHLINRIIENSEKQGKVPAYFPAKLPVRLANLALNQIKHLDDWNAKRQANAAFYEAALKNKKSVQSTGTRSTWLRFPVQVADAPAIRAKAKARQIILGDWYTTPIAPADALPQAAKYTPGTCDLAEKLGQGIINLPTDPHLTQADLERVVSLFD